MYVITYAPDSHGDQRAQEKLLKDLSSRRPGLGRLLEYLITGHVQGLWLYRLDGLTRCGIGHWSESGFMIQEVPAFLDIR